MQLHIARLCLDCSEVHDSQRCSVCGSEAFAYLSRWVPAPERRLRNRTTTSPEVEAYRELVAPTPKAQTRGRLLKRGALSLTMLAAAGWAWRWNEGRKNLDRRQADLPWEGSGDGDASS